MKQVVAGGPGVTLMWAQTAPPVADHILGPRGEPSQPLVPFRTLRSRPVPPKAARSARYRGHRHPWGATARAAHSTDPKAKCAGSHDFRPRVRSARGRNLGAI